MSRDQVFISYSHEDRKWRDDIEKHLQPYLRSGSIESWSDRQITPGSEWLEEIQSALKHSKVAVLLVSPDFLASDFIHEHELGHLLKEAEHGGVRVLWIPVRESAYKQTPLKNYQAVLDPAKPLASMTAAERDQAWVSICEGIEKQLMAAWLDYSGAAASFPESVPDTPAALLDVLTSGEFPKQAEHRQAELRAINHAPAKAERNPVDCTVFAPARVERKQVGLLQVFLHAPEDRKQADAAAEKFDPGSKERGHRSLVLDAPIGTTFAFDVEIEGFVFPERIDTLIWTGHPQSATFRFEAPGDCKWGQRTGTVWISIDGAPVGRISFQIEVVPDTRDARNRPVGKEARHYHACFCSYSSLDRDEMLKRAQGLQAAGLETFIDVLTLRPGDIWNPKIFAAIDESDLFVVIWSKNARDSKWVKKESRYALKRYKQYGSPDFRPIPVEGPPIASVPQGLQAYHFNDELLGLIRAAELERRERERRKSRI